jgi:trehalose 6-phosphate synthase
MRQALRFLLPLLGFLGVLAWGAAALLNFTTLKWSEKDLRLRAELAVNGAHEALVAHWRSGDHGRVGRLLTEIARDERIMAAAACGTDFRPLARTRDYPSGFECGRFAERVRTGRSGESWSAWTGTWPSGDGAVHVSAIPVADDAGPLGFVLLIHDMSYVSRRSAITWRLTVLAFAIVGLAASVVAVLIGRFSWRSWTAELRRLVRGGGTHKSFRPFRRDVRELVGQLAAEMAGATAGPWSPQRLQHALNHHLEGESIVMLANREPYIHQRTASGAIEVLHPASGLVTALEPVMRACSGVWIAHGSGSADREVVDRHDRVRVPPGEESYTIRRVWLDEEEERGYYFGFCNEGLWPLCHVVDTRPTFRSNDWEHYQRVNRKFADVACAEATTSDPIILVQDYHFALAPRMIRERLPHATVITFWHIPWPNSERFGICPWHEEILRGLLGSSILGFHTQYHCNNFVEAVDRFLEARIDREQQAVVLDGRPTLVRAYPISIDWPNRWATAAPPTDQCREELRHELGLAPGTFLGVGVDRLDYTKGIEERLLAVERLLERFPQYRGRFTFAQLAAPSRTAIERYRLLNQAVEACADRINARFATPGWRPIVLMRGHHEPPDVFRYYRAADLCYVSSLHDGMNLVAKEFVAARDDERGVLILSRFTGAARELTEALLVNPYDLDEASSALAAALSMPLEEQEARMRSMRDLVREFNVYRWAGRMLVDAARLRRRDRMSGQLLTGLERVDA